MHFDKKRIKTYASHTIVPEKLRGETYKLIGQGDKVFNKTSDAKGVYYCVEICNGVHITDPVV